MSLRFIYGSAGSGKSHYCLENIKERLKEGNNVRLILLVPEQFSFQSEKNLIKIAGEKALTNTRVLSFTRMANTVFNEVGGVTREHMNSAGKCMLIYKILEEVKKELKVFSRVSKQQGFINIMADIITELKRYDVSPLVLQEAVENLKEEDGLKEKLSDINLIFTKFEEALHKNYIDSEDELSLLADKLDKCEVFNGAEIWVDEFSSFTPRQYRVLSKLLKKAKRVNITLNTNCLNGGSEVDYSDLFMPIKNTEKKLLKILEENNVSYEKPLCLDKEVPERFINSKELAHLEKHFFSFPYKFYKEKVEDISVFKALNMYSEIEETARNIVGLVRDKGFRYRDIAVVTRDLKSYEKLVQVIFGEYKIPYFIDQKRDINSNPLIIFLNSAIEVMTKNWSYEAVFRYLKTGLTTLNKEEIDLIENYVLANGIKGKRWLEEINWEYRLNYSFEEEEMSEYEKEVLEKINEIKSKITEPLAKFFSKLKTSKTVKEICTVIFEFLNEVEIVEKIEGFVESFEEQGDLDAANEYSQIWNIIIELLDQMVEVLGEEELKLDQFLKILATGIGEYQIGLIPPSLDQVLVGSIERVKSHEVEALYIVGVNDGIFPKGSNDEGILTDRDREELKNMGVEIALDTKSRAFEEQFLIYTSLTIPRKYLRLSYPIANFEGKTLRPSIIISRVKKIFSELQEKSNIVKKDTEEENLEQVTGPLATFNSLVSYLREDFEEVPINSLWWDVYRWYSSDEKWKEKCIRAYEGISYTNQVDLVNSKKLKKLYGVPMQFSVSRLEKYVECPFAYYVQYGLKAKERKVYEFTAPDLGTFMHNVIKDFAEVLEKEKMSWKEVEKPWAYDAISLIVDKTLSEKSGFILNSSARYKYMADRLKRILTKSVGLIAEHIKRSDFTPMGYELSFGKSGDFPPIQIDLSTGDKVELIGRIDRIDEFLSEEGTYLRIIDYKSGNKAFKLSDVYYGLQIQLLVYLDAILENADKYSEKEAFPGAILYFKLDDPIINSDGDESLDKIEDNIMKKLKMNGLLLKDAKIVKAMDKNIDGYSLIIPARINKDGTLGKSSAATLEEFKLLREYIRTTVVGLCEEMISGDISIKPYKKKGFTPCSYCKFASVCQFDTSIEGNKYNVLNDKKDDEVWELMRKEVSENGNG